MFRKLVALQASVATAASIVALVAASVISTPATAQPDTTSSTTQQEPRPDGQVGNTLDLPPPGQATTRLNSPEIVVTGSHLRRDNFNMPAEINVLSKAEADLNGTRDLATSLQAGSITSGSSQINGAFLGFVSQNGPGANTTGLRGLGSQRTLILLNGRRLSPAGVGPQLIAPDLNVLPSAIVDRIEILREGASSVYGSDAIAGVINIITADKLDGVTLDGFDSQPTTTGGAGNTLRGSIAAGKVFSRGHITASFEYRQERGLVAADRAGFTCPRNLLFDPATGAEVGSIDPVTGRLSCYSYEPGGGPGLASGYGVAIGRALNRITYLNGDINNLGIVNGLNRVTPSLVQNLNTVITPLKTYTGYLNGSYELGILGSAEVYGEALFTRRGSQQQNPLQLSILPNNLSPSIQTYGGGYAGTPVASPFFPNSVGRAGYVYFTPFILPQQLQQNTQRVDFIRTNGGLRGNLGFGNWRYDANFQYSRSNGSSTSTQTTSTRLSNALRALLAPTGTPANLITTAIPGEFGAGNNYTCASNVSAARAFIPGSSCVPLDLYNPAVLLHGAVPDAVYNYLYQPEIEHTTYTEEIVALNIDGKLVDLPAGPLNLALGYEHRHEALNDVPSLDAQTGNIYNYSNGGITRGSDAIDEAYGELNVPMLRDKPFARMIELNLSGRYTHYRSYGSDFTYHINATYAVNDVIRFRGNYGTSFRAPNLYENYVARQTGFSAAGADPCDNFGNAAGPGTTLYNNCLAALTPILGSKAAALNYVSTQGPEVITQGAVGVLKSETSTAYGGGIVLTAPEHTIDLSFSADYFNITVKGEIQQLGTQILSQCYQSTDFANDPYCALIAPREVGGAHPGVLLAYENPYINVAMQKASGIDFDVLYQATIIQGRFNLHARATRNLHQQYQPFAAQPISEYNGTLGRQTAGAGPKTVGNLDADWTDRTRTVTLHYGLKYVGRQDSTALIGPYIAGLGLGAVNTIEFVGAYFEHDISVKFHFADRGDVTLGVANLTNANPPILSQTPLTQNSYARIGNYFNSSNYDLYGRSVFLHFAHTFK